MQDSKGTIPIPALYLAASLRKAGFVPSILDLSVDHIPEGQTADAWDIRLIQEKIRQTDPAIVGFNCFVSQHFPFINKAADILRQDHPHIHFTVGGAHPTLFAEDILTHCTSLDSVVLGEGEAQLVSLAQAIAAKQPERFNNIQALAFRSGGQVIVNPRQTYISDLDDLPTAAWDLIDLTKYYSDHGSWNNPKKFDIKLSIPILTSRSCPFKCNFCACHKTMGRTFRMRSPQRVVDEIEMLNRDFGMNYFGFIDDNVNLNKQHVLEICDEILRRKLDIQFEPTCGLYLGTVDEDIAAALGKAGCVFARLPVEHGNDHLRNTIIGKNLPREQIFRAKKLLKANGMRVSTMCIMGFPEETKATLQDTYDLLIELDADLNYVFNLIPFPGTKVFEQAMKEGLLLGNFHSEDLWKGEIDLDPVQHKQQYYLRPRAMTLDELDVFREKFNRIRVMHPS